MKNITAIKSEPAQSRALVVFGGQTELAWLRILHPGFRHCFLLIECAAGASATEWVLYNPLSNATQITIWPDMDGESLKSYCVSQGYCVVETYVRPLTHRILPWRPFTCVEAVKRALGVYSRGIFTPWQLYKFLKRAN